MEIGSIIKQSEGYDAFIPNKFPPLEILKFPDELNYKHSTARGLLGKLDGIAQLLPDVDFFIFMYVRKDAESSTQIEGTQADMIDAIEAETKTRESFPKDVDDILNYIKALNYGIERLNEFPMSLRFIRELHMALMKDARSTHVCTPGEFRQGQNWIGGTSKFDAKFVPPPPHNMNQALDDFEKFLHNEDFILPLLKVGLIHAQFETIHPFLDGNGRTGRILITLYLWLHRLLEKPVLFLSSYFLKHQNTYYERLNGYHHGQVNEWLDFLLDGITETAEQSIITVKEITDLRQKDMEKIQSLSKTASESGIKVLKELFKWPIINNNNIKKWTGFTLPGAQRVIDRFVKLDILQQKDKNEKYGRSYIYKNYVDIFNK